MTTANRSTGPAEADRPPRSARPRLLVLAVLVSLLLAACGSTPPTATPVPATPGPASAPAATPGTTLAPSPAASLVVAPLPKDWPVGFRGDAARRAEGDQGPIGNPVLRWRFQCRVCRFIAPYAISSLGSE